MASCRVKIILLQGEKNKEKAERSNKTEKSIVNLINTDEPITKLNYDNIGEEKPVSEGKKLRKKTKKDKSDYKEENNEDNKKEKREKKHKKDKIKDKEAKSKSSRSKRPEPGYEEALGISTPSKEFQS